MSSSKNLEFEKTSFLNKSNSAFIEQMYLKFLNKDPNLPEGWANYFEGIGEEINVIANEINGPSWSPKKNKIDIINDYVIIQYKVLTKYLINFYLNLSFIYHEVSEVSEGDH